MTTPYSTQWRGQGYRNHLTTLDGNQPSTTYSTSRPPTRAGRTLPYSGGRFEVTPFARDYPLLEDNPRPLRQENNLLISRSEENRGYPGGPVNTYSSLVPQYNLKGNGNYPISKPDPRGSNARVLPERRERVAQPVYSTQLTTTDRMDGFSTYSTGGRGRYNYLRGSNSPETIYTRGLEGSYSPETVETEERGLDFSVIQAEEYIPYSSNRVRSSLYSGRKARSNYRGNGSYSGDQGIDSAGNNSGYGASSPGFSPENYNVSRRENYRDAEVDSQYRV